MTATASNASTSNAYTVDTLQQPNFESSRSAVAWTAILGGAVASTAISIILLDLAAGLGLSFTAPLNAPGAAETASSSGITAKMVFFVILMQAIIAGFGGYITGRLRTKWANTHSDEVFFRDTAHGFLSWAIGTIFAVGLTVSAASSVVMGGASAVSSLAGGAASMAMGSNLGDQQSDPLSYFVDNLFRSEQIDTSDTETVNSEAARILARSVQSGNLSATDRDYLAQLISARTGLSPAEAGQRVDTAIIQVNEAKNQALQAAETARKAAAKFSMITVISLLIGAFIASYAGVIGGRHRDQL